MTPPRHRGTDARSRAGPLHARLVVGLVVAGVALAAFVAVGSLASGDARHPSTTTFTGVVTDFADDGALMCVRRQGSSTAPFCDLFYVPPDTPQIGVGDRVLVRTITSRDEDGSTVSGMLVTPLP